MSNKVRESGSSSVSPWGAGSAIGARVDKQLEAPAAKTAEGRPSKERFRLEIEVSRSLSVLKATLYNTNTGQKLNNDA